MAPDGLAVGVFLEQLGQRLRLQLEACSDFRLLVRRPEADGVGLALGQDQLKVDLLYDLRRRELAEIDRDKGVHTLAPSCSGILRLCC
ncbi:hypothetical protein D3C84_953090 [compost metagenome]